MSSIATPATSPPMSLGEQVAAALQGGVPTPASGPLQTAAPETQPAPVVEAPVSEPPSQEAAPQVQGEPPVGETPAATEIVDDFSLGLDGPQAAPSLEQATEQPPQAEAKSDVEQFVNELASHMTHAEAQRAMGALLRLPKGKQMLANFKQAREVSAKLGFDPTPDDIVTFQQSHIQHARFWDDFSSPERHPALVGELFSPDANGQHVQGAEAFVSNLTEHLKQVNPQLYQRVAVPIAQDMSSTFRQFASEAQSEEDRQRWTDAARLIDWASGVQSPDSDQQETPKERALREQLQRERAARMQGAQQSSSQAVKAATGTYFQSVQSHLNADVDLRLSPIKDKVDPVTFDAYRRDLYQKMHDYVQAYHRNEVISQRLKSTFATAAQRRDRSPLDTEVTRLRKSYETKLAEFGIPYIQAAGKKAAEAAQATAAKLQQAQTKTEPAQTTSATHNGVSVGMPTRIEGETADAYRQRTVAALLGSR